MPTLDSAPPRRQSFDELVAASLHDPVALGKLCKQFRKHLREWVREHFPDGDSDLVQDAFLVGMQRLSSFRGNTEEEFTAWLRTIVLRLALKHVRAQSRREQDTPVLGPAGTPEMDRPDPGQVPPDEVLAAREQFAAVRAAVQDLPAEHQVALDLRFQARHSFGEIGRRLGRSAEAARKLVTRALEAVARRLGGNG